MFGRVAPEKINEIDSYNSQDDIENLNLVDRNPVKSIASGYQYSDDIENHNYIIITKKGKFESRNSGLDYNLNIEQTSNKYVYLLRVLNIITMFVLFDAVVFFSIYSWVTDIVFFKEFVQENENVLSFHINNVCFYIGWFLILGIILNSFLISLI